MHSDVDAVHTVALAANQCQRRTYSVICSLGHVVQHVSEVSGHTFLEAHDHGTISG